MGKGGILPKTRTVKHLSFLELWDKILPDKNCDTSSLLYQKFSKNFCYSRFLSWSHFVFTLIGPEKNLFCPGILAQSTRGAMTKLLDMHFFTFGYYLIICHILRKTLNCQPRGGGVMLPEYIAIFSSTREDNQEFFLPFWKFLFRIYFLRGPVKKKNLVKYTYFSFSRPNLQLHLKKWILILKKPNLT